MLQDISIHIRVTPNLKSAEVYYLEGDTLRIDLTTHKNGKEAQKPVTLYKDGRKWRIY